jgi:hypothetical protein
VKPLIFLAATVPAVAVTIGLVVFSAAELSGGTPLSNGRFRNMAEAAGRGDASEVLRRMRLGDDPNRVEPVDPDIISSRFTRLTPLEAAVFSHHVELVHMLDRLGAIVDVGTRQHLTCLAADIGDAEIVRYFVGERAPDCAKDATVNAILARTATQ